MKKLMAYIFLLLTFLFCHSIVPAQTSEKAQVGIIDAYCKTIDSFTEKFKSPQFVFADAADYERNSKSDWKKFASEKVLEKFREKTETYSIAYNWQKNNKIVKSNFTLFSPSGDWTKYVYLYFRQDGTLAKAESELRTFYGNFIALNDIYFDSKGKISKKTVKYIDLTTKKPRKLSEDDIANNGDNLKFTEYYKNTNKLPFAHLIKVITRRKV
jgi:hypothetical protein